MHKIWICSVLAWGLWSQADARADIPPPQKNDDAPPAATADLLPLEVRVDRNIEHAVLQIPRDMLPAAPQAEETSDASKHRTIVAGLAMSAAFVSMVLLRRGNRNKAVNVGLILLAAGAVVTTGVVMANAPADFGNRSRSKPAPANQLKIELLEEGDQVSLVLPQALVDKLRQKDGKRLRSGR